jgi:hypothetical protein
MPDGIETERREALRSAITTRDTAAATMQQASEAHERGLHHVNKLRSQVADFISLDATIDAHITEALRLDGHADLPEELASRLAARDVAQTTLASAERAASTLLAELAAATETHKQAEAAVTSALRGVTDVERGRLREKASRLKLKSDAIYQLAGWGNTAEPWRAVCDALLADPQASITIPDGSLPDEPEAEPPARPFVILPPPYEMTDTATGETVTVAEFHRRRRAEILAQAGPVSEAMAIEAAIMRSRKLAG